MGLVKTKIYAFLAFSFCCFNIHAQEVSTLQSKGASTTSGAITLEQKAAEEVKDVKLDPMTQEQTMLSLSPRKTTWWAKIVRQNVPKNFIPEVRFAATKFPIYLVNSQDRFRPMAIIDISLSDAEGELFVDGTQRLPKNPETGRHILFAYLNSKSNEVVLTYKNTQGVAKAEKIFIVAPEAQEYSVVNPSDAVRFLMGSTYLQYSQTSYTPYYSWTGLLGIRYTSPEKLSHWGINGEADMTVLTIDSNQGGLAPQLGEVKLEAMYFAQPKSITPERFQYLAGAVYLTLLSNGTSFGFKNLIVPDVGVKYRYITGEKSDYSVTARLALLDTDFKDKGLELELNRSFLLPNLHRAEIGFKFLEYQYHPNPDEYIQTGYMSLFISYTL
jgi:hypothetical protein